MSAAASSRHRAPSKGSGRSTAMRPAQQQEFATMPSERYFEPCAATGNMFLYAQGASVICCQHDTLSIERIFSSHAEEIQLLAVDNHSDLGSGRFVVSYDAGQTAIVWDLATGDEVARFASYEHLTAAAWMKSGSVAFGNMQGSIILFEPTTSEHISSRTLDQIPVTSLAPSSDCRTFAIGYQNGTLLIATLQPRFTILHNLTTSRGPSPLVTLSWHASSSRQKSDMLATQTLNGDLRVWSIAKSHSAEDAAKVVRILKRSENFSEGPNWMGWSKNGRVIQFSDSQTLSWDVRTKHVTSDNIPTLEHVRGLALWGPGAILFTLGRGGTVQQFDLNTPSIMVSNVQHPVNSLPPSPPNSIEEPEAKSTHSTTTIHTSESENSSIPLEMGVSESDEDHLSPFDRFVRRPALDSGSELPYETGSPVSSRSEASEISRSSGGSKTPGRHTGSLRSRGNKTENTYISAGSSLKSSTIGNSAYGRRQEIDMYSMGYSIGTTSVPSVPSTRSRHRPSRLRNEVPRSPDDNRVHDLFKYTRTRLTDLPYKHPANANNSRLTNDDLRRQMLSTIFGWHKDVEDLIADEMSRHPTGSANRILLAKWLGEMETDLMAAGTENMTSSDWMLLALSGIGGQASQQKVGRTYVQRLLETGDVHVAVTIMLGMGDHNDAIEVYVSHKRYMEALILTCLVFPSVWERQASIIRKWGKHEILRRNEQLAIRCFACTDSEPTEAWTSPSATQLNFQQTITPSIPEMLSPPLSPPGVQRGPQRSIAKTSALKLITSFGDTGKKAKFYSQGDDGQTPIAAGPTPIADSAISPGGAYDAATAFLRPSSNSRFNTPTSARPRGRLPSIGENTMDANNRLAIDSALASFKKEKQEVGSHARKTSLEQDNLVIGNTLHRAATASPMMVRDRQTAVEHRNNQPSPPSPNKDFMAKVHDIRANHRNGSRDRIPHGLHLELKALANEVNALSPDQAMPSSSKYHWPTPTRRRGPGSVSSVTSASSAGRSLRQGQRHKEDYIHSLDAASRYSKKGRSLHSSKERARDSSRGRNASVERKVRSREPSEERGRGSSRAWHKPKRSPTSPVPMSPEDIAILSTPRAAEVGEPVTVRKTSSTYKVSKPKSRNSSRGSRRQSPDARARLTPLDTRGRSKGVDEEGLQATSPAPPLSATILHYEGSEDEEDYRRAVEAQELFRAKHNGSASRAPSSPVATKRDRSGSRRRDVSEFRDIPPPPPSVHGRAASTEHAGDLRLMKEERQRKKEQAARELEERRKSLAHRARAPSIPNPGQNLMDIRHVVVETSSPVPSPGEQPRCATAPLPKGGFTSARHTPVIGLPATPKAMRIAYDAESAQELPKIPSIPPSFVAEKTEEPSYEQPPSNQQPQQADPFTLLPSTVYQPPTRPFIPRSMSAPIPDDPTPRRRKGSSAELRGIDEVVNGNRRRRSQEEPLMPPPPPPPPAPPLLRELQHLAKPPPPPPAPLPNMRRPQGGALGSGMIEIVMDDDDEGDAPVAAPNDGMVPVIPPPAPPASKSHSRGRSTGDTSISGRISKATERLRSASRGPKEGRAVRSPHVEAPYESIPTQHLKSGMGANHSVPFLPSTMYDQDMVRSPHAEAPYESVPTQHLKTGGGANHSISIPPPVMYDQDIVRSPVEGRGAFMSTGMHKSEMI
ncbi:unnamed protein product [Clonostachys chloroleuca]|uniref:Gem-associated protein 5 TPR domain-containing protein n=1 Tax=Clonostachys chloroleuca TaxID=1926264 RepID=A0AA35Q9T5_9HYPO|nr:unnamed protein product [Clonostachys chloroleuca]